MEDRDLLLRFEFFQRLPEGDRKKLLQYMVCREVPAGTITVDENCTWQGIPFVISGEFRAYKVSENGREIELYSILPGETCIVTVASVLGLYNGYTTFSVAAVQDSRIAVFPADKFRAVYSLSPYLQQYIFINVFEKFYSVIDLVERLTFKSVTARLREYLEGSSGGGKRPVYSTHAEIAAKLGTSREVVTRKLRDLENEGLIKTTRGKIIYLAPHQYQIGA